MIVDFLDIQLVVHWTRKYCGEKTRKVVHVCLVTLQNNGHAQKSRVVMPTIRDLMFHLFEYPPYSPDLTLLDYHGFPQLKKKTLKGYKFPFSEEALDA